MRFARRYPISCAKRLIPDLTDTDVSCNRTPARPVIAAKAEPGAAQDSSVAPRFREGRLWVPAFAGMTVSTRAV